VTGLSSMDRSEDASKPTHCDGSSSAMFSHPSKAAFRPHGMKSDSRTAGCTRSATTSVQPARTPGFPSACSCNGSGTAAVAWFDGTTTYTTTSHGGRWTKSKSFEAARAACRHCVGVGANLERSSQNQDATRHEKNRRREESAPQSRLTWHSLDTASCDNQVSPLQTTV